MDHMDTKQEECDRAYQQLMIDIGSMDDHTKLNVILELLDKLPISDALDRSSSLTLGPLPGIWGWWQIWKQRKRDDFDACYETEFNYLIL